MGAFSGVIRLRRDNDYNYKKIENTFIPAAGEVCLVDVAGYGLRAKVGTGATVFKDLPYTDENLLNQINGIIVRGYYIDGAFYLDAAGEQLIEGSVSKLYIDITHSLAYSFDGTNYSAIGGSDGNVPNASATVAGIMKLYDTVGQNTDGTMTQKAISDELDDKIEVSVNLEEELVIFDTDINP